MKTIPNLSHLHHDHRQKPRSIIDKIRSLLDYSQCFTHGQLYTALSRAVDRSCYAVHCTAGAPRQRGPNAHPTQAHNVVWPEVFS
jgi:hypothetical protein